MTASLALRGMRDPLLGLTSQISCSLWGFVMILAVRKGFM